MSSTELSASGLKDGDTRSRARPAWWRTLVVVLVCLVSLSGNRASAQDPFGAQARADAVSRMLVLGIQQGISSLPPTSGQSFSYVFDPELATLVAGKARLEPVSLRSTQLVSPGTMSFRFAGSMMNLRESFGPNVYEARTLDGELFGYAEFGSGVDARIGLFNVAANYGIRDRIEIGINVPLVWVDVEAWQTFSTPQSLAFVPSRDARVGGAGSLEQLEELKRIASDEDPETDGLVYRSDGYRDLGLRFHRGSHVGLGRVSVGGKALLLGRERVQLAAMLELFLPSPNEDEFAGSESVSLLPRLVARYEPWSWIRLHGDVGYEGDFQEAELRRFVWNAGASLPGGSYVADLGFGGSVFEEAIAWSPRRATSMGDADAPPLEITALGSTTLGRSFVDALAGLKLQVHEHVLASVAVTMPLNEAGLRSDVVVTVGLEVHP